MDKKKWTKNDFAKMRTDLKKKDLTLSPDELASATGAGATTEAGACHATRYPSSYTWSCMES